MTALRKIYFIGIGGIGMSALARYYHARGVQIFGYDKTKTELTESLERENMQIHYEDRPDFIPKDIDLFVITPAVPHDLLEYKNALQMQVPVLKRSKVLGQITSGKQNIAVAGTHGKTTTSVMIAHILYDNGMDITAFLGGIAVNYQTNFLDRGDEWMIEEADEYDKSFLTLYPDIAIIGSLDADHLDIYGTREIMRDNYLQFAKQIKRHGILLMSDTISDADYHFFKENLEGIRIERFGFNNLENQVNITGSKSGWTSFDFKNHDVSLEGFEVRMPGEHNIRNAAASIRVAIELGVDANKIRKSLKNFAGIKRRFEWIYETPDTVLIDDYAHHPEELRSAILACRKSYPGRKILGIFQPHLYTRTRDLMDGFVSALNLLDKVIVVEIYPAREQPIPGVSAEQLYSKLQVKDKWVSTKTKLSELLLDMKHDVVMTLGAGDLDMIMDDIKAAIFSGGLKTINV